MADPLLILTNFICVLASQITVVEGGHYFRRYYYYYQYSHYFYRSQNNSTRNDKSAHSGWYAGAAVGVIISCFLFLGFISICMKFCIQRMNRRRLIIKPQTQRPTLENRATNSYRSQISTSNRPFNLQRQLQENISNRQIQISSTNRYLDRPSQRQKPSEIFNIDRQLPDYREACTPPPAYTSHDHPELDDARTSGLISPPPSYREVTEQESIHR